MTSTTQTPETETHEFTTLLKDIRADWSQFKSLQTEHTQLSQQMTSVRRLLATRHSSPVTHHPGRVSDDCARHIAASFIAHCEKSGKLEALCSAPSQRDALINTARDTLNLTTRAALTTGDVPLPVEYSGELRELISDFGVVRRHMHPYPIGMGTARPARMGTRPTFGSIAMSAAITEKSPALTFASLESHKIGGIVRLPREIDEQSIIDAFGSFVDPGANGPTVTFTLRFGATTIVTQTQPIQSGNWHLSGLVTVRSGGVIAGALAITQDNGTSYIFPFGTQTAAIDITPALNFDLIASIQDFTTAERVLCEQLVIRTP
jgi:hypothetical protein